MEAGTTRGARRRVCLLGVVFVALAASPAAQRSAASAAAADAAAAAAAAPAPAAHRPAAFTPLRRSAAASAPSSLGGAPPPPHAPPPDVLARIRREAAGGSRDAQYQLGVLLYFGLGVAADAPAASRAFREAASRGHATAAANLAHLLERGGGGVTQDAAAAFAWYSAAAEGGERQGMLGAGRMLYEGRVPGYAEHERFADAFSLFERAVEREHPEAYFYLGALYEYGAHKPQDFVRAAELYSQGCSHASRTRGSGGGGPGSVPPAVAGGDADCCFHLGLLHAYGRGMPQDFSKAAAVFQACFNVHAHAGCALYLGTLYAGGQGTDKVDYDLARLYLQQAADAGDVRYAKEAHTAFSRLDGLVREAEAQRREVLDKIERDLQPPAAELAAIQRDAETVARMRGEEAEAEALAEAAPVRPTWAEGGASSFDGL